MESPPVRVTCRGGAVQALAQVACPGSAKPECFALLGPLQRQAGQAREPCRGEIGGLPPFQDGADDLE